MKKPKIKEREKCSYHKNHVCPTPESYQKDLYDWWLEYATRGDLNSLWDVENIISRLRDYLLHYHEEHNTYGFPHELSYENRIKITRTILFKIINSGLLREEK